MPKRPPEQHTGFLVWCTAVICAILTVAVIIAGIIVFIGYIAIRPKVPQISVTQAQLDVFEYDQAGILVVKVTIFISAENDNAKADASFYNTRFVLGFQGITLAYLHADPFDVSRNNSLKLKYEVESSPIPLGPAEQNDVYFSLLRNAIYFDLKGNTRTRWRIGFLGSVKFSLSLDCQLRFSRIGDVIYPKCSTKSK
ncbi:OLC1v1035624C1 [Oldenlandia corymbosa var. corymbosa]|uniref:OLC1v1035624C1 n=1 Tax=Oldenlandia corymbosa var. corymbosa TaxID=529605 RepID=A0AAV1CTF2_OLDCO|nr:OLC1v1035624C1 [Oldenlandia corymbosa var. corymbosa]